MNIYVGNFTFQMAENDLRQMFETFGRVETVKIIKNRFSGRLKGFGFVEMPKNAQADKAVKALNGDMIEKRPIKVIPTDSGAPKKKTVLEKEDTEPYTRTIRELTNPILFLSFKGLSYYLSREL